MTQRMDYNAAVPAGVKALGGVYGYIMQSGLPKALLTLVYLRVSQINGCAYCIDMHSRDLLEDGMSTEKLVLVPAWRESGALFQATERAALAWAETVTRVADTGVPDGEYQAVAAVFDQKQLGDLTIAIGLMNVYNRLAMGFRVPPAAAKRVLSKNSNDVDPEPGMRQSARPMDSNWLYLPGCFVPSSCCNSS